MPRIPRLSSSSGSGHRPLHWLPCFSCRFGSSVFLCRFFVDASGPRAGRREFCLQSPPRSDTSVFPRWPVKTSNPPGTMTATVWTRYHDSAKASQAAEQYKVIWKAYVAQMGLPSQHGSCKTIKYEGRTQETLNRQLTMPPISHVDLSSTSNRTVDSSLSRESDHRPGRNPNRTKYRRS